MLTDEELQMEDGPGDGWAPVHAADLLGELQAPSAIEPMIRVLLEADPVSNLRNRVLLDLKACGEAAAEPILEAWTHASDPDDRNAFCEILCGLGVRSEAIFEALKRGFREHTQLGAMALAEYGDPRALPILGQELDDFEVVDGAITPFDNQEVIELHAAIEQLGGELTPSQNEKLELVRAFREAAAPMLDGLGGSQTPAAPKVGRNEPCWCGSGKKYKKCHWSSDRGR
jgi:HEAT repeat protein